MAKNTPQQIPSGHPSTDLNPQFQESRYKTLNAVSNLVVQGLLDTVLGTTEIIPPLKEIRKHAEVCLRTVLKNDLQISHLTATDRAIVLLDAILVFMSTRLLRETLRDAAQYDPENISRAYLFFMVMVLAQLPVDPKVASYQAFQFTIARLQMMSTRYDPEIGRVREAMDAFYDRRDVNKNYCGLLHDLYLMALMGIFVEVDLDSVDGKRLWMSALSVAPMCVPTRSTHPSRSELQKIRSDLETVYITTLNMLRGRFSDLRKFFEK